MDLVEYNRQQQMKKEAPLAARMRPDTLEEFVGQSHIIGKDKLLSRAIEADRLSSIVLYGPPGTGKTTLAKIIANTTKSAFEQLNATTAGAAIRNKDVLRVAPSLDYIRDVLAEPLTLDQIAGRFFISKHYLCRIFKSATGFSVMEYIIYSRILRARQLLQEGVSVQQAGELSGFSDNSHVIRTFVHPTGITPGRYAKEYQFSDQILLRENL